MAMPRPSGKALEIAEKVVPGLSRKKTSRKSKVKSGPRASMSFVETTQTNNTDNQK